MANPIPDRLMEAIAAETAVDAEVYQVKTMDIDALRRLWIQLNGERPPKALSKGLLALALAYRFQERAIGGLNAETRKTLRSYTGTASKSVAFVKPGSTLVREYQGVVHEVEIISGGFRWNGRNWASLTMIARAITGTNWNGPRFFGLRAARKQSSLKKGTLS